MSTGLATISRMAFGAAAAICGIMLPEDLGVLPHQIQPRFAGLLRSAGGDDHDLRARTIGVTARAHRDGADESGAMHHVHGLALGPARD